MKIYPDKLAQHLKGGLKPIYLLHGDEPLGLMQAGDLVRKEALAAGYSEREVIFIMNDEDWGTLQNTMGSMSLFAEQRVIDLRLPSGKPGRVGAQILKELASSPNSSDLLVLSSAKLERAQVSSAWFKAIGKVGVTVAFWPVRFSELPRWIERNMKEHGLNPTREAVLLVAELVEGNMLAARQEIERLSLLYPAENISAEKVMASVTSSARYSVNDLIDAAMQGATGRCLQVLDGLQVEGFATVQILWSLTNEIRSGAHVAQALAKGRSPVVALKAAGVWSSRVDPLKVALNRHTEISWIEMLLLTSHADRVVKGHAGGDPWLVLKDLCFQLSGDGKPLMATAR